MAYDSPDHRKVINELLFTDQAGTVLGISGRVILSGTKLLVDTGTAWETVTAA